VLHHREFLAEGGEDPRRRFAETLIVAIAAFDGPIVVYSAYEQTRLKELAGEFPDLSASLNALIARLVDLLPIVRGAVYLPEFRFSNSIKSVAPALCPGFGYDDLDGVADGAAMSAAFLQLASGDLTVPEEVDHLRSELLAYCQRDTLAMVEVHRALTRLAAP
jgi:predicted RecB family nuclease